MYKYSKNQDIFAPLTPLRFFMAEVPQHYVETTESISLPITSKYVKMCLKIKTVPKSKNLKL